MAAHFTTRIDLHHGEHGGGSIATDRCFRSRCTNLPVFAVVCNGSEGDQGVGRAELAVCADVDCIVYAAAEAKTRVASKLEHDRRRAELQ